MIHLQTLRVRQNRRKRRCFPPGQSRRLLAKEVTASRPYAVNSRSELGYVKIDLQDALLGQADLDDDREPGFQDLAQETSAWPQKQIGSPG